MDGASRTTDEWAEHIGAQLRALRIDAGLGQADVAERASLSRAVLSALENGTGSTVSSLVKVLAALEATEWLEQLHPTDDDPSPLQLLRQERNRPKPRARVSRAAD